MSAIDAPEVLLTRVQRNSGVLGLQTYPAVETALQRRTALRAAASSASMAMIAPPEAAPAAPREWLSPGSHTQPARLEITTTDASFMPSPKQISTHSSARALGVGA
jgi:hypothetical protein